MWINRLCLPWRSALVACGAPGVPIAFIYKTARGSSKRAATSLPPPAIMLIIKSKISCYFDRSSARHRKNVDALQSFRPKRRKVLYSLLRLEVDNSIYDEILTHNNFTRSLQMCSGFYGPQNKSNSFAFVEVSIHGMQRKNTEEYFEIISLRRKCKMVKRRQKEWVCCFFSSG